MCGICGSVGFHKGAEIVQRMTAAMVHRGPDDAGFFNQAPVHLGMRRLRIIDLHTGDQPIFNEDKSVSIICNGEIYNFREIRHQLESLGHHFRTTSDTEVIVHAYEEWGKDCLKYLRGMFAFALYDGRESVEDSCPSFRLFLARDRLGIKPLYIWHEKNQLLFASEVRSLLASGKVPGQLSIAGLYSYLAFGSVQEPLTLVNGIHSMAPASWVFIEPVGAEYKVQQGKYWMPGYDKQINPPPQEVHTWLMDAVSSHLISDVPLGAFLSGGLDSGSIVALASQALDQPLNTFTLGFDNWPADERQLAELTSLMWKTKHQIKIVNDLDILGDLPNALSDMDQPTVDGINSWFVSRQAKGAGLTVALSGVGGDELFAGYPSFRLVPFLKRLPGPLSWLESIPAHKLNLSWLPGRVDTRRKLWAYMAGDLPLPHPYFAVRGLMTQSQILTLLSTDTREQITDKDDQLMLWKKVIADQIDIANNFDGVGEVSWLEISQYMRSTLLRDTDMMSMAHSLEVRVPFLDHVLVEQVMSVAGKLKMRSGVQKPFLVGALQGELPDEISAGSKRTFTFPFQTWMKEGLAAEIGNELQGSLSSIQEWINPRGVSELWHAFEEGSTNWARPWSIYVLNKWVEKNL